MELKLLRGIAVSLVVAFFCLPFAKVPNNDWQHNWADWLGEAGLWCALAGALAWAVGAVWDWSHTEGKDVKQ